MKFTGYIDSDLCTFTLENYRLVVNHPDGTTYLYNEEGYDEDSWITIRDMLVRDGVRDVEMHED